MSIRIGFLACEDTLPGKGERRGDAFEHDIEVTALRPAFADAGLELVEIDWRAPLPEFAGMAMVLLGTAWDYQDYPNEFVTKLDALQHAGISVQNSPAIVRWNSDKGYLRELEESGAATVPTLWLDDADVQALEQAMDHFASDRVIVKRQVGAGGMGQFSFTRSDLPGSDWKMGRPCMVQPFLPSIVDEGEYTFVFIDSEFSHGVQKIAAPGEYRIQSLYGGHERAFDPPAADLEHATRVLSTLPFDDALYCRIDMARLATGQLAVMEVEMIEPYLYPEQGPDLGERLAEAIGKRLA